MKNAKKIKKSSNNKGFTLVELIIVVAIIAVLAAVLAPQYLQYVERARQSNDLQVATSIMRASTVAVSDPRNNVSPNAVFTITWQTTGTPVEGLLVEANPANAAASESVADAIADVMGWEENAAGNYLVDDAQSANGNNTNFTFTLNASTGAIVLTNEADWGTAGVGVKP